MQACNETVNIQGERRVPFSAAFMRLAAVTAGLSAPAAAAAGTYTQIYTSVATTAEPRVAFFSPAGVLYGTTMPATASRTDTATIFALTPPQNGGSWSYAALYQFKAKCKCNVILTAQDDAGNVYGNTTGRLRSIAETLFKFNLASKKLTTLYTFPEDTGGYGPVLASDGDLYFSLGLTIYQLSTKGKLTSFYTFAGSNQSEPTISQDGNGNLLGEIAVNQTAAPVSVYELNIARKSLVFQTKALSEKVAAGITAFVFDSAGVPWAADRIAGGSQPPGPGTIYNFDVSTQMAGLAYSFSEQLYAELCAGAIDRNAAWKCDLWNGARVRIGG